MFQLSRKFFFLENDSRRRRTLFTFYPKGFLDHAGGRLLDLPQKRRGNEERKKEEKREGKEGKKKGKRRGRIVKVFSLTLKAKLPAHKQKCR